METETALIVVDVQNDFCPGGNYPVPKGDEIIAPLNRMIRYASKHGWKLFFSRDWHSRKLFDVKPEGAHCLKNTKGANYHPVLQVPTNATIISKGEFDLSDKHYSAFNGDYVSLNKELRRARVRRLYIGGLAFDYCVKNTALDAARKGYEVFVLLDATRAVKKERLAEVRKELEGKGVKLVSSKEVLKASC